MKGRCWNIAVSCVLAALAGCSSSETEPAAEDTSPAIVPTEPVCVTDACERVVVAAGPFTRGCNEAADDQCDQDEFPTRQVGVDTFHLDRLEVTASRYQACVDDGGCTAPTVTWAECNYGKVDRGDHPINCISQPQATAYCAWAGGRLPTEAEWEKAARGEDHRVYPWGDQEPTCELVNFSGCHGETTSVGSKPLGASAYGALDMAGNVLEWVSDFHGPDYYSTAPDQNPTGPETGTHYTARGGSHAGFPRYIRCSIRDPYLAEDEPDTLVGVRCAYTP